MEEKQGNAVADVREVTEYLTSVMRGESESVIAGRRSDGEVQYRRPDEKERLKAAELLGKKYAMFKEAADGGKDVNLSISIDYGGGEP